MFFEIKLNPLSRLLKMRKSFMKSRRMQRMLPTKANRTIFEWRAQKLFA